MKFLVYLLFPLISLAQINITPANPTALQGNSITIQADRPVKFQLLGNGSISSTQGTSTVYSAPATVPTNHAWAGCMVSPNDSIFNMRVDSLPVLPQSSSYVTALGFSNLKADFNWSLNVVDNSNPGLATQTFSKTTKLNGTQFSQPITSNRLRENGAYTTDNSNPHRMIVLNTDTCQFYETNQLSIPQPDCSSCTAASGWTYSSTNYALPPTGAGGGTTDAAGLPLAPLTVHLSEIKNQNVAHALRMEACTTCIGAGFVWPATTSAGNQPGAPPAGTRFRLKASFDISSYPSQLQTLLTAMKKYGVILADTGDSGAISVATDVTKDSVAYAAIQAIATSGIQPTDFEAVDESYYMGSSTSYQVIPGNPYANPYMYADLVITDAANSQNKIMVPISIRGYIIGVPDQIMTVQAGSKAFQIPYWVYGATDQGTTWTIYPSSGVGTIDNNGIYTPPATVNNISQVSLRATSTADPKATMNYYITLLPAGTIRINVGAKANTTDDLGFTWLANVGSETGSYTQVTEAPWGPFYNSSVFATYMYTEGNDILYKIHLPNGSYTVEAMFGKGGCTGQYSSTQPAGNGLVWGSLNLQILGNLPLKTWDFGAATSHTCQVGETVTTPALVNNQYLTIGVRATGGDGNHSIPILNGLVITPVSNISTGSSLSSTNVTVSTNPGTSSVTLTDFDSSCGTANGNCRSAFQKAFNLLAQAGGGTLQLPAGTFMVDFPEVAQDASSGPNVAASSLIPVPPNTTIKGTVDSNGNLLSTITWRITSMPAFVFAKANNSGMQDLHLQFTGTSPTDFPYGDSILVSNLGYKPAVGRSNAFAAGAYEMSTFIMLFDSENCTFNNLVFDSANNDNGHVYGYAFNLKGKSLMMSGGSGLQALASGNRITNVKFYDFHNAILSAGQNNLLIQNITADRRGVLDPLPPGHVLYTTGQYQWDSSGSLTKTMQSTNVTVDTINEGSNYYTISGTLGTLAIKCLSGATVKNITSQHPAGLIQTLMANQNVQFLNMTWSSDTMACDQSTSNCSTPVINSVLSSSGLPSSSNLTFKNINLTSTGRPISTSIMGDNLTLDTINITTSPNLLDGQANPASVLGIRYSSKATVTNYTYKPLITSYDPAATYNNPFEAWDPSSNTTANVSIIWPASVTMPKSGARIITPAIQDSGSQYNNIVSTSVTTQ